ncbi:hypothetical protein M2404_003840 [Rheinheimera pacifica]|uniref:DUF3560 domain-containing protein n=1 Tax=Rheinheimera pacifica TaxID=173990 RepID=UPI002166EEFA|nr:DUF3560 domain-containing protein [Rheinheimera pacifica]MCS4309468.1 hypothetical protein [Rheinheimera pacifica]
MKKKTPSAATVAAKKELIELSAQAKMIRENMVAQAETNEEALAAASLSINDILIELHKKASGAKEFKTFQDWKAAGFNVRKGEKAFRIWGKPLTAKSAGEPVAEADTGSADASEGNKFEFFPMACVFSDQQVEPTDHKPESETESEVQTAIEQPQEQTPESEQEAEPVAELAAPGVFTNPAYAERQQSRAERYSARAAKAATASDAAYKRSHDLVSGIPMGQPILVGHHSEARHRRTLDKSWNAMGKSVQLSKHAEELASRAASVGTAGIASDDPEALQKLKEKLASLQKSQDLMKKANALIRQGKTEQLPGLGLSKANIDALLTPQYGRVGFASYQLTNNNAEINRLKKRIESLTRIHASEPMQYESEAFDLNVAEGRLRFKFHNGKPSEEARKILGKRYAFKFSRTSEEWVRKVTPNAIADTRRAIKDLNALGSIY